MGQEDNEEQLRARVQARPGSALECVWWPGDSQYAPATRQGSSVGGRSRPWKLVQINGPVESTTGSGWKQVQLAVCCCDKVEALDRPEAWVQMPKASWIGRKAGEFVR